MMDAEFESVIILSFEVPENTSYTGVIATGIGHRQNMDGSCNLTVLQFTYLIAMVQFSTDFGDAAYEAAWNAISSNGVKLENIDIETENITQPADCPVLYTTLSSVIPTELWDASGRSTTETFGVNDVDGTIVPWDTQNMSIRLSRWDNLLISNAQMVKNLAWMMTASMNLTTNTRFSALPVG